MDDYQENFYKLYLRYTDIYKCIVKPTSHNIKCHRQLRNYHKIQNDFMVKGMEFVPCWKQSNLKAVSKGKIITVIVKIRDITVKKTKEGKYFIIFHEQA